MEKLAEEFMLKLIHLQAENEQLLYKNQQLLDAEHRQLKHLKGKTEQLSTESKTQHQLANKSLQIYQANEETQQMLELLANQNRQLHSKNQHLQQLLHKVQQVHRINQQLTEETHQLGKAKQQLHIANKQLHIANKQLQEENQKLQQLNSQQQQLHCEDQQLHDELEHLRDENQRLQRGREGLLRQLEQKVVEANEARDQYYKPFSLSISTPRSQYNQQISV